MSFHPSHFTRATLDTMAPVTHGTSAASLAHIWHTTHYSPSLDQRP